MYQYYLPGLTARTGISLQGVNEALVHFKAGAQHQAAAFPS